MGEFVMPSLGSQMIEAKLVKWHIKPGDKVKKGDIIGEIDTEKGLIDIEVFEDGVITDLIAKEGEVVPVGSVMAVINGKGKEETASKKKEPEKAEEKKTRVQGNGRKNASKKSKELELKQRKEPSGDQTEPDQKEVPVHRLKASPLARRVAEDLGVDLTKVKGSGDEGAIHKKDVEDYAKEQKERDTFDKEVDMAEHISKMESGGMRQSIAAAMERSNREIPHYYLETDIDMKKALEWLERENNSRSVKERLMSPVLLIKAVAEALIENPNLNGFWDDNELQIEESVHVGFAISLRQGGLVIPAILDADLKSIEEIQNEFVDMVNRARDGHLRSREISSATITITSLGERGVDKVYGVIYPPQVALIGFGKITNKPSVVDDAIGIRPILSTSLAADHRATDGQTGSQFLAKLNDLLNHPENMTS